MSRVRRPWKRSFLKLPGSVLAKLENLAGQKVRVASVRVVPRVQIEQGHLLPIGVRYEGSVLVVPSTPIVPPNNNGPWALRNRDGWEITRRDLPKRPKTFSFEAPHFGDWSKGWHSIDWTRVVYEREVISPRNASVRVTHEGVASDGDGEVLRFELEDLFDPSDPAFLRQILLGINVLQESTGCSDVFHSSATPEDMLAYRFVDWVIFPPGESEAECRRAFHRFPGISEEAQQTVLERRIFLESLHPREFVLGKAFGASTYFGAIFRDNLVVFENIAMGNAIYIMFDDWATLSRLSRTELLRDYDMYRRIVHTGDWKSHVLATISRHLSEQIAN